MNRYIYIIGTICVLFLVVTLFVKLLPFLIIAGIVIYAIAKFKGKFKNKKIDNNVVNRNTYNSNTNSDMNDIYTSSDDYTNGEIIDVDYEDVNNK